MTPDIRKERETALYEAALRLIAKGVNPAAMKVQQIADEAGIGKGTVYEYFASKDEILQGMALYCFDTEIARIAVLMEPCTTLQELEDAVMAYLQDLSGNRMGTYQVIASSIGARENLRGMDECVQALRGVLHRTMAALRQKGEINPALPDDYCDLALLSAAAGGLIGLCYVSKHPDALTPIQNLRVLIHRALNPKTNKIKAASRPACGNVPRWGGWLLYRGKAEIKNTLSSPMPKPRKAWYNDGRINAETNTQNTKRTQERKDHVLSIRAGRNGIPERQR